MRIYKVTFAEEESEQHYISMQVAAISKVEALIQLVNTRHVHTVKSVERIKDDTRRDG